MDLPGIKIDSVSWLVVGDFSTIRNDEKKIEGVGGG